MFGQWVPRAMLRKTQPTYQDRASTTRQSTKLRCFLLPQERPFIASVLRSRVTDDHDATPGRHTRSRRDGKSDRSGVYSVEREVHTVQVLPQFINDNFANRSPGCSLFLYSVSARCPRHYPGFQRFLALGLGPKSRVRRAGDEA